MVAGSELVAALLAGLFGFAAGVKILRRQPTLELRSVLEATAVPESLVGVAFGAIAALELLLATLLLWAPLPALGLAALTLLLYRRRLASIPDDEDCACFGDTGLGRTVGVARVRNATLAGIALLAAIPLIGVDPGTPRAWEFVVVGAVAAALSASNLASTRLMTSEQTSAPPARSSQQEGSYANPE